MKAKKEKKVYSLVCVVVTAIILAINFGPVYYLARIIRPSDDDYLTSLTTRVEYMTTGSIWKTIKVALEYVVKEYMTWQGTWSFNFFECLQPGVWGDQWYWIGPVMVVSFFIGGYYFLGYVIFKNVFEIKNPIWMLVITVPLCFWQQYLMFPEQAYFWWTGASYYLMYHGWAMIILGSLIRTCKKWDVYKKWQKIVAGLLLSLGGCFIGGGNFTTALMLDVILGLLALWNTVIKKNTRFVLWIVTVPSCAGLLVSVLAPGNNAHMDASFDERVSVFAAIITAIKEGFKNIYVWTRIEIVLILLASVPFIYIVLKEARFEFNFPGLITFLSFGVYLSGYAPAAFAIHGFAPGRMINLYYISYYMLLWGNVIYWTGWVAKKDLLKTVISKKSFMGLVAATMLLCCLISGAVVVRDRVEGLTIYKFRRELSNNLYKNYDEFMNARYEFIETHPGEKAVFQRLPEEYHSVLFYWRDWGDNATDAMRNNIAKYYGLSEIEFY